MKRIVAIFLVLVCILGIVGCNKAKYNVEIADNYPIANHLKHTYAAGEEVTVKLETITEHYYVLSVNGDEVEMDRDASDLTYTYFTFTMPGEDVLIQIEDKWVEIPPLPPSPVDKYSPITLTIVETEPSGVAFEYQEPNTPYCFYAYDADENLYRVLWTDWEGLKEKNQIIVEYEKLEELTYEEYPDGGWNPQYEMTAVSVRPAEIASCISTEVDAYVLTLPKSKEKIEVKNEFNRFVPYISDALVQVAETKITDDIAQYGNSSGFYLQVSEDYLCLVQEVIHHMDPPAETDSEYVAGGCGFDHEHLFFSERISICPVNNQTTSSPDEDFWKGTVRYFSEYLDQVNFVAGLSQSDFISLVGQYRYNGASVTDIDSGVNFDGPQGGGWQLATEDFSFVNNFWLNQEDMDTTYSNKMSTSVPLEGLPLPYGIDSEDTLTDVFKKIGIQMDPIEDFHPDENSDIQMTLYQDERSSLVFRNLWYINEPVDFLLPYEICFSETYEIPGPTTVHRTVTLRFECTDHCGLGQFEISVDEINALE